MILLEDCTVEDAAKIAEKIREEISRRSILVNGEEVRLNFSAGVAEHRHGESLSELAIRADQLMYEAKRQGKNRVVFANQQA